MNISRLAYILIVCVASVFILIYLESILIPFVFAVIIWFLIKEFRKLANKIGWVDKYLPNWVLNLLAFSITFGLIAVFSKILATNVEQFQEELPKYEANIDRIIVTGNDLLGMDILTELKAITESLDLGQLVKELLSSLSGVLSNIFLVILYVVFLMAEESVIPNKLKEIFPKAEKFQSSRALFHDIDKSIGDYLVLKTVISLITGILSYIALLIIGVDFPVFWAILIFLLNYIPTIGSLIATVFPAATALLQFGEIGPFILVLSTIGIIQVIVGNFIEPKVMGNSLNISSLVVLLSLAFWGYVWGVVGMILCVPITVIMIIFFSRFQSTRPIAVILSGSGKLKA